MKNNDKTRYQQAPHHKDQYEPVNLGELVPEDHLLKLIDREFSFDSIYDLTHDCYSDKGRPAIDPVVLFKLVFIRYLFGIRSMRQTIKECEVNLAYRWFLGLGFHGKIPHFSTFSKNYARRYAQTDIFEKIFYRILKECVDAGFVDPSSVFIDSTPVKAHANRNKKMKKIVRKETTRVEKDLQEEINEQRESEGKKSSDPDAGEFRKGEHKREFAYSVSAACDAYGWILGYDVCAGNIHDARSFFPFFEDLCRRYCFEYVVMDAGYKTSKIAHEVERVDAQAVFPYKRPMGRRDPDMFSRKEFIDDEAEDVYLCPMNESLSFSTIDRKGYRIYKSSSKICMSCPKTSTVYKESESSKSDCTSSIRRCTRTM